MQAQDKSALRVKERIAAGLGLDTMEERVELCDGSFFYYDTQGTGTSIQAAWPV